MKTTSLIIPFLAPALLMAGDGDFLETTTGRDHAHCAPGDWNGHRVDAHAPIGVMADHSHGIGEFMLSYRFMRMSMDGNRDGTNNLSSNDVFDQGYMVAPTEMEMDMHMFGLMYAPTDRLTLMAMANYQEIWMDHDSRPGSMPFMMRGATFRNHSKGWGDLSLSGIYKLHEANQRRVQLELGVSAPTGEFDSHAYPMQPTSGTWDLIAGATWLWQSDHYTGGAQVRLRVPIDENTYGYSVGEEVVGTTWVARRLTDWASVSARLTVEWQDSISGSDERIGAIMAPPMEAANHGGTWVEGGIGLNLLATSGPLKGHRLAVEALLPIHQDLNGPQLKRDWSLIVGWQKAF